MKVLILALFVSFNVYAQVIETKIYGNSRTDQSVIEKEISDLISDGEVSEIDLLEIDRRIWNLRIFSEVKSQKNEQGQLEIHVKERWTTIPIAKLSGGGGSTYYAVGAYDINTFGKNIELGAQYESLNNRDAGVLWIRKPQFLNNRNIKFGIDLWNINRAQDFYDEDSGDDLGAMTLQRRRFNTFIEYKWDNDFYNLGFQYDYQADEISEFGLSDEMKELNAKNNFLPDEKSINRFHTIYFKLGRLDYKNYLVDGSQLSLTSSLVTTSEEEVKNLNSNELKFNYYKVLPNYHNFAWQFKLNTTNLESLQNQNYLGGFGEVRGYMDGQYYDQATWQNNIEYRFDVYENKLGVIQAAVFSDQAKEGEDISDLTESKDEILFSSGVGLRFISPKIYRFVGRLDYAQTHTRSKEQGISFGIQQFF